MHREGRGSEISVNTIIAKVEAVERKKLICNKHT